MWSKILGLPLFGQVPEVVAEDSSSQERPQRRRKLLNTRHWRELKNKKKLAAGPGSTLSESKENLPPQQESPFASRVQSEPSSKTLSLSSPRENSSSSPSSPPPLPFASVPLSPTPQWAVRAKKRSPRLTTLSEVRGLRIENTSLKAKVAQLEAELQRRRRQSDEEITSLKLQVDVLKEKLSQRAEMKRPIALVGKGKTVAEAASLQHNISSTSKKHPERRDNARTVEEPKKSKLDDKAGRNNSKKAKTDKDNTDSEVIPLSLLAAAPPPPPPPPPVLQAGTTEGRKNLKRRAIDEEAKKPRQQPSGNRAFMPSLNEVVTKRSNLRPLPRERPTAKKPEHDELTRALFKKFENANFYSPNVPGSENNERSFSEILSPYRLS